MVKRESLKGSAAGLGPAGSLAFDPREPDQIHGSRPGRAACLGVGTPRVRPSFDRRLTGCLTGRLDAPFEGGRAVPAGAFDQPLCLARLTGPFDRFDQPV